MRHLCKKKVYFSFSCDLMTANDPSNSHPAVSLLYCQCRFLFVIIIYMDVLIHMRACFTYSPSVIKCPSVREKSAQSLVSTRTDLLLSMNSEM